MYISELKKGELKVIDEKMAEIGFFRDADDNEFLAYWKDIEPWDKENVVNHLKPNHFTPKEKRMAFIAGGYVTSDIRGTFRGYRCRNICNDYDTGNIFAHSNDTGNTILAVEKWINNYRNHTYNRR